MRVRSGCGTRGNMCGWRAGASRERHPARATGSLAGCFTKSSVNANRGKWNCNKVSHSRVYRTIGVKHISHMQLSSFTHNSKWFKLVSMMSTWATWWCCSWNDWGEQMVQPNVSCCLFCLFFDGWHGGDRTPRGSPRALQARTATDLVNRKLMKGTMLLQVKFISLSLDHSYALKGFTGHMIMGHVIIARRVRGFVNEVCILCFVFVSFEKRLKKMGMGIVKRLLFCFTRIAIHVLWLLVIRSW